MRFLEELKGLDWFLVLILILIQVFGLIAVYSATYVGHPSTFFYKHLTFVILFWIVVVLLASEKFENFLDLSFYVYLANVLLLLLVLLYGVEVNGARRWIRIGFLNLQPSEFMKFSLILISAYLLPMIKGLKDKRVILLVLIYAIPAMITLKQPDLGTTGAYFVPLVFMLLARGVPLRYFVLAGISFIALIPLFWNYFLKPYQKQRILAVIDPYSYYYESGYQLIQSKISIGSGMLFGKGILEGTQTHLLFLPEKHTDFIFAVIGEEFGFLGTATLTLLFFLLLLRMLTYYMKFHRLSEEIYAVGVFSLILFQFGVNTLMTMGYFPVVGIPLPFVSMGGSAMLSYALMIGLLQSIYKKYKNPYLKMDKEPIYE